MLGMNRLADDYEKSDAILGRNRIAWLAWRKAIVWCGE